MLHGRVRQFRKFMNRAAGGVHNFQKEHRTNIFLVRTEQASSIKVLLLCLYLKFTLTSPKRERATKPRTLLLFRHFPISSAKCVVKRQGKGIYLTPKCFLLNIFSRTQISEIVRERSTLAVRIYLAKFGPLPGTNQNARFHHEPVQPYNKISHRKYVFFSSSFCCCYSLVREIKVKKTESLWHPLLALVSWQPEKFTWFGLEG